MNSIDDATFITTMDTNIQDTEDQILSTAFTVDEKLNFSHCDLKVRGIIEKSLRPVTTLQHKQHELNKGISIPSDYIFASLSCRIYQDKEDGTDENGISLHGKVVDQELANWQLLTVASNSRNGYMGTAYWNSHAQQVIIVHRGTYKKRSWLTDLQGVLLNQHVSHINSAITFTSRLIDILRTVSNEHADEKEIGPFIQLFFTGHSLGGWLASITTFSAKYMVRNGKQFFANKDFERTGYHASAKIFDPPGCETMLQQIQNRLLDRSISCLINTLDITTFVSAPNLINTCNPSVGNKYRLFISLSDEEKRNWVNMKLHYTLLTHQMNKIKEVFDPRTGEVLKNNDKLRIKKVRDWPMLLSGNDDIATVKEIFLFVKQAIRFVLPGACSSLEWYAFFDEELKQFFKLAIEDDDFHLEGEEATIKINETTCRVIRYKTEDVDENYKNECKLNTFTKSERQFLEIYQFLMVFHSLEDFTETLPALKPENLLAALGDHDLICKTKKVLKDYKIENEVIRSNNLQEFIPFVKRMLQLFQDLKHKVSMEYHNLPTIHMRNGLYQSASKLYLNSVQVPLEFENTLELDVFLNSRDLKLLHIIQPCTYGGIARIYQNFKLLDNDYKDGNNGFFAFLDMDRILCTGWSVLIRFLKNIDRKYLLVIECNNTLDSEAKQFFTKLFENLRTNNYVKTILVTRHDSDTKDFINACVNFYEFNSSYTVKENIEVRFSDLTMDSRKKLLERKVIFQGKESHLYETMIGNLFPNLNTMINFDLDTIIDSEIIARLAKREKIEIGVVLPQLGEVDSYYIHRTLIRKIKIKENIFKDKNVFDIFAVSNISENELSELANHEKVCNFKNEDHDKDNPTRFIILDGTNLQNDFETLCNHYTEHNLHWIKKEGEDFIWKSSQGALTNLHEYVDSVYEERMTFDNVDNFNERFVIIAAEPGMGKSTAFTYLGVNHANSRWLLRINLIEYKDQLGRSVELNTCDDVVSFLIELIKTSLASELAKKLMKLCLKDNGNIALFLDGFDEICPNGQENVVKLLKALQKTKVEKVLISTRLHLRNRLENALSIFAYKFLPFTEEHQKEFLIKFWRKTGDINENLCAFINKILNYVPVSFFDKKRKFLEVPLHIKMIAEVFQDELEYWLDTGHFYDETLFYQRFNMPELYNRFIRMKYQVYFSKIGLNINLEDEVQSNWFIPRIDEIHEFIAFNALFPDVNWDFLKKKLPSKAEKHALKLIGIIQFINNEVVFIHSTFAEYFVANMLVNNLNSDENSEIYNSTLQFLDVQLFQNKNAVIKLFIDEKLIKSVLHAFYKELPDAVISSSTAAVTDILGRSALHYLSQSDNSALVEALLNAGANAQATDKLGKTPLHYTARYSHTTEILQCLLKEAGDCMDAKDNNGCTPLFYAAEKCAGPLVWFLKSKGADINTTDAFGNTPLHMAAKNNFMQFLLFLLFNGANIKSVNKEGKTCMDLISKEGRKAMFILFPFLNPDQPNDFTEAALDSIRNIFQHLQSALITS